MKLEAEKELEVEQFLWLTENVTSCLRRLIEATTQLARDCAPPLVTVP